MLSVRPLRKWEGRAEFQVSSFQQMLKRKLKLFSVASQETGANRQP